MVAASFLLVSSWRLCTAVLLLLLLVASWTFGKVDSFGMGVVPLLIPPTRTTSTTAAHSKATKTTTATSISTSTALGALEVDATSEVVVHGSSSRSSPSSMMSLFLREAGAITVPRGVAPGCLTSPGVPIVVVVADVAADYDAAVEDPNHPWTADVWDSTLPHRRSDLVWVTTNGAQTQPRMCLSDQQRNGTVVLIPQPTTNNNKNGEENDDDGRRQQQQLRHPAFVYGKHATGLRTTLLRHHRGIETVSEVESWTAVCELAKGAVGIAAAQQTTDNNAGKEDGPSGDSTSTAAAAAASPNNHRRVTIPIPAVDLVCTGVSTTDNGRQDSSSIQSVIVVGGGILGSSIARALSQSSSPRQQQQQTPAVTLYDPTPTGVATPASWAWLNANQKPPQAYKSLNQMGLRAWRSDPVLSSLGSLRWSGTLVRTKDPLPVATEGGGYAVEGPLGPERIRELEPEANFPTTKTTTNGDDGDGYVYYFPDEGHVDPQEAVRALRREAANNGVAVVSEDHVVGLVRSREGRVVGVKTSSSREHLADVIVVAAGAGASALAGVPMVHKPSGTYFGEASTSSSTANSSSSSSSSSSPVLRRTLVDMVSSLYLAQRPDGTVVAGGGATKFGEKDDQQQNQHLAMAQEIAQRLAPNPVGASPLTHRKEVSSKPMPKDGFPILGFIEPGLYAAVTHSGMTLSPLIGQLVAAEVKDGVSLSILDDYRPARFDHEDTERDPVQDWQERETQKSS